jgi:D-alanyl-D-alanine dipeptidase
MSSWRDTASEQAQVELDTLLDTALSTAQHELVEHGEFVPFAVVRRHDGATALVGTVTDGDHPAPEEHIGRLWDVLRDQRDGLRAAALVSDWTYDSQDQLAVQLEHAEGQAIEVTLAYRLEAGSFEPGDLSAGEGIRWIW